MGTYLPWADDWRQGCSGLSTEKELFCSAKWLQRIEVQRLQWSGWGSESQWRWLAVGESEVQSQIDLMIEKGWIKKLCGIRWTWALQGVQLAFFPLVCAISGASSPVNFVVRNQVHTNTYTPTPTYAHTYIYIHKYIHTHIHTYTHIHWWWTTLAFQSRAA